MKITTLLAAAALALLTACGSTKSDAPALGKAYPSARAAVDALVAAADTKEPTQPLRDVLGGDADALLDTGDSVQLRNDCDGFLARYAEHNATVEQDDGSVVLVVGNNRWPFPIPLVRDGDAWRFDCAAGIDEMLDRRIGRNELAAIEVCRAIVDAQSDYRALAPTGTPCYAARFFSTSGKRDGLYWRATDGEVPSPLGELVADAAAEGYRRGTDEEPTPYHGYHYRILTAQGAAAPGGARSYVVDGALTGGHAVVAWPAEYGRSGIMTFVVNQLGIVFQRDLGADTDAAVEKIDAFDPDDAWTPVVD